MMVTSKQSTFYKDLSFEDDFNPSVSSSSSNQFSEPDTPTIINHSTDRNDPFNELALLSSKQKSTRPKEKVSNKKAPLNKRVSLQPSPLTCYTIRLEKGDDLRKSLISYAKELQLKAAFVLTCVGSATSAKLRLANAAPNTEANYMLDIVHPTEIVSLEGTISDNGHLHVALSDSTGKILGGHLIELIVDTTAEVVIGECNGLIYKRVFDENTGFKELTVEKR